MFANVFQEIQTCLVFDNPNYSCESCERKGKITERQIIIVKRCTNTNYFTEEKLLNFDLNQLEEGLVKLVC